MFANLTAPRRALIALIGALILGAALSACGSSHHKKKPVVMLDTKRVALAIVQSIKSEKNLTATVSCPPKIPQKKGYDFKCVATTYAKVKGKKTPVYTQFTVKQINDRGNVYYSSPPK